MNARPIADRAGPPPAPPELSRPVPLEKLAGSGLALEINASPAERKALAARFGFESIGALSARVMLDRTAGGVVKVEGRVCARIVQNCVLTLDPVPQTIDEPFRLLFQRGAGGEGDDLLVSASPDSPEPLEGSVIDAGEIVAEQLALAADPYPRKPGLALDDVLKQGPQRATPPAGRHRPFAALRKLRDRQP
jgi:uncharacterized metal-binding protein YceD (DUF177 family)